MTIDNIKQIIKDFNNKHNTVFNFDIYQGIYTKKTNHYKIVNNITDEYSLISSTQNKDKWILLYNDEEATKSMDLQDALDLMYQYIEQKLAVKGFLDNLNRDTMEMEM